MPDFPSRSYRLNTLAGSSRTPLSSWWLSRIVHALHVCAVSSSLIAINASFADNPSSRWNEKNPAVCIPTALHNVSNPHLFAFLLCLLYTYDTRPAPLITLLGCLSHHQ